MKKVDLEQGSPEWHEWRASRWMASEAAIVMGRAPTWFQTRSWDDLMIAKMGLAPEPSEFVKARMQRGHELEPEARQWAIDATGYQFEPTCIEGSIGKFAASLDGLAQGAWLEIKCVSPEAKWHHKIERDLDIPEYIRWQLLGQWAALGRAPLQCYLAIWDEHHPEYSRLIGVDIEALAFDDHDLILELETMWKAFDEMPDSPWPAWAQKWHYAVKKRDEAQFWVDECARELLKIADGKDMQGCGVKATTTTRRGSIDWQGFARDQWRENRDILEEAELYRRKSTTSTMIKAVK